MGTTYDDLFNCLTTRTVWAEGAGSAAASAGGSGRDTPSTTGGGDQQQAATSGAGAGGSRSSGGCHMVYRGGAKSGCGSSESVPLPSAATSPATSHRQLSQSIIGGSSGRQSLNRATSFSRGEHSVLYFCSKTEKHTPNSLWYRQPRLHYTPQNFAQSSKFLGKKFFFGTKVTSQAFLCISQILKVKCLQGSRQTNKTLN